MFGDDVMLKIENLTKFPFRKWTDMLLTVLIYDQLLHRYVSVGPR